MSIEVPLERCLTPRTRTGHNTGTDAAEEVVMSTRTRKQAGRPTAGAAAGALRRRLHVSGVVQGVGFRPFVYRLAAELGLAGFVANDSHGVVIEVEGAPAALDHFHRRLLAEAPPLAAILGCEVEQVEALGEATFEIRISQEAEEGRALISPDVATCADCLRELRNRTDRRFRYAFTNCTNCGPRFTIIEGVPYDRPKTTMSRFQMCPDCQREYDGPADRRFHAQPNACAVCGPKLTLLEADGRTIDCDDPAEKTIDLLSAGKIVAVKGLGGYHLACLATDDEVVARLRRRKLREEKPLAIMSPDLATVRTYAQPTALEEKLLKSHQRPIVLVRKRPGTGVVSDLVAPRNAYLGVMLPYTPLHHLLMEGPYPALVMTSGNRTDEPIVTTEVEARERLRGIADAFLTHDRPIARRADDSVVRVARGRVSALRRSRGYVPLPVALPEPSPEHVLALGAELKSTVCFLKERNAFLSQHIGDLKNLEANDFFTEVLSELGQLLDISPTVVAHDLHPAYFSTRFAKKMTRVRLTPVQHHHAHLASCLAEHGRTGPALGIICDGVGYGEDGTAWGGELLIGDACQYRRVGHLRAIGLPGGDAAAKEPWRMALAYLMRAVGEEFRSLDLPLFGAVPEREMQVVVQMIERGVHCPSTTGLGRLFDAASALAGVALRNSYEGQAPMEFEGVAEDAETEAYPYEVRHLDGMLTIDPDLLIRALLADVTQGAPVGVVSARFHNAVVAFLAEAGSRLARQAGLGTVVLSGGCFQNQRLVEGLSSALETEGFEVLTHSLVPANDGGIALGQAWVAASRLAADSATAASVASAGNEKQGR